MNPNQTQFNIKIGSQQIHFFNNLILALNILLALFFLGTLIGSVISAIRIGFFLFLNMIGVVELGDPSARMLQFCNATTAASLSWIVLYLMRSLLISRKN